MVRRGGGEPQRNVIGGRQGDPPNSTIILPISRALKGTHAGDIREHIGSESRFVGKEYFLGKLVLRHLIIATWNNDRQLPSLDNQQIFVRMMKVTPDPTTAEQRFRGSSIDNTLLASRRYVMEKFEHLIDKWLDDYAPTRDLNDRQSQNKLGTPHTVHLDYAARKLQSAMKNMAFNLEPYLKRVVKGFVARESAKDARKVSRSTLSRRVNYILFSLIYGRQARDQNRRSFAEHWCSMHGVDNFVEMIRGWLGLVEDEILSQRQVDEWGRNHDIRFTIRLYCSLSQYQRDTSTSSHQNKSIIPSPRPTPKTYMLHFDARQLMYLLRTSGVPPYATATDKTLRSWSSDHNRIKEHFRFEDGENNTGRFTGTILADNSRVHFLYRRQRQLPPAPNAPAPNAQQQQVEDAQQPEDAQQLEEAPQVPQQLEEAPQVPQQVAEAQPEDAQPQQVVEAQHEDAQPQQVVEAQHEDAQPQQVVEAQQVQLAVPDEDQIIFTGIVKGIGQTFQYRAQEDNDVAMQTLSGRLITLRQLSSDYRLIVTDPGLVKTTVTEISRTEDTNGIAHYSTVAEHILYTRSLHERSGTGSLQRDVQRCMQDPLSAHFGSLATLSISAPILELLDHHIDVMVDRSRHTWLQYYLRTLPTTVVDIISSYLGITDFDFQLMNLDDDRCLGKKWKRRMLQNKLIQEFWSKVVKPRTIGGGDGGVDNRPTLSVYGGGSFLPTLGRQPNPTPLNDLLLGAIHACAEFVLGCEFRSSTHHAFTIDGRLCQAELVTLYQVATRKDGSTYYKARRGQKYCPKCKRFVDRDAGEVATGNIGIIAAGRFGEAPDLNRATATPRMKPRKIVPSQLPFQHTSRDAITKAILHFRATKMKWENALLSCQKLENAVRLFFVSRLSPFKNPPGFSTMYNVIFRTMSIIYHDEHNEHGIDRLRFFKRFAYLLWDYHMSHAKLFYNHFNRLVQNKSPVNINRPDSCRSKQDRVVAEVGALVNFTKIVLQEAHWLRWRLQFDSVPLTFQDICFFNEDGQEINFQTLFDACQYLVERGTNADSSKYLKTLACICQTRHNGKQLRRLLSLIKKDKMAAQRRKRLNTGLPTLALASYIKSKALISKSVSVIRDALGLTDELLEIVSLPTDNEGFDNRNDGGIKVFILFDGDSQSSSILVHNLDQQLQEHYIHFTSSVNNEEGLTQRFINDGLLYDSESDTLRSFNLHQFNEESYVSIALLLYVISKLISAGRCDAIESVCNDLVARLDEDIMKEATLFVNGITSKFVEREENGSLSEPNFLANLFTRYNIGVVEIGVNENEVEIMDQNEDEEMGQNENEDEEMDHNEDEVMDVVEIVSQSEDEEMGDNDAMDDNDDADAMEVEVDSDDMSDDMSDGYESQDDDDESYNGGTIDEYSVWRNRR